MLRNKDVKKEARFSVTDISKFRIKMLNWVKRFNIFCLLDNHAYHFQDTAFECLLAAGADAYVEAAAGDAFSALRIFSDTHQGEWMFGHFCYDLKNETEQLHSANYDGIGFPDLYFFVPQVLVSIQQGSVIVTADDPGKYYEEILNTPIPDTPVSLPDVHIQHRISQDQYISAVERLRQHILRGDCYEINFCQEFFAENLQLDPLPLYQLLSAFSPNPFAGFYRINDKYCLCASPERYLQKEGLRLISQPIKGTARRDVSNSSNDDVIKQQLKESVKEQAENVMVVDLVRNDLSRICQPGSVKVDELFGIYSFPQVHQMISTVSGKAAVNTHWTEIIKNTFPMGSMTGVPKKRVMELIEHYESTRRGLYSGAIGYVTPGRDFDFNVVIRSIMYNSSAAYLSFQAGGAITFASNPRQEYAETLLKAAAIKRCLTGE